MRILLFIFLSFIVTEVFSADCQITWDANPIEENITHYTLYKSDSILVPAINGTEHTLPCDVGSYSLTASNEFDIESPRSDSVVIGSPSVPKTIIINIVVN